nr:hypothetical protein [Candidatus Sigynarchaeota archaeon]
MDPFDDFKARNKQLFKDLGIDTGNVSFSTVSRDPDSHFKYGKILKELARSKSFPASINSSKMQDPEVPTPLPSSTSFTQEAISKKMRLAYAAPIAILATAYLVFMLFF